MYTHRLSLVATRTPLIVVQQWYRIQRQDAGGVTILRATSRPSM